MVEIHAEPRLVELARAECLTLLPSEGIGRVVVTQRSLPAAHPVHYVLDGEEAVFRTARNSTLASAVLHAVVAFQADDVDLEGRSGWTVYGIGEAYEVVEPGRLDDLQRALSPWWGSDDTAHTISIPLQILHGRLTLPR
ncbi:pyridoxamine 5'-phosphate oxidase family protein [Pseudonocardia kujensis]|uniref:pyridoxamine 5'-phosphate oxidase family protein n=1 Tax=Pseudonocardia kujensis TaxID=1128675 RepID=UPI001E4A74BC|nr:pyridoxamine 5'-phosphate oxidase family protein [Pseudonocardia kujensis]MCE0762507.1 pyridoxamine 5'-phosphate oxidase family protein [Pseudonocardia kujensis]